MKKIILTPEQQQSYEEMVEFLHSTNKISFTLKGYAGTGKTTIIKNIIEYVINNRELKLRGCIACTSTHQANKVLKKAVGDIIEVRTIASLFKKVKNVLSNKFTYTFDSKNEYSNHLFIADECSMINNEDFAVMSERMALNNCKIIFMGDDLQIPPVKSNTVSPTFTDTDGKFSLTKVVRQEEDNPILKLTKYIRENPLSNVIIRTDINKESKTGILTIKSRGEFKDTIQKLFLKDEFKADSNYCKIICYTNAKVSYYNDIVRKTIHGEDISFRYLKGDLIKGYEQVSTESPIKNGSEYLVIRSSTYVHSISILDFSSIEINEKTTSVDINKLRYKRLDVNCDLVTMLPVELKKEDGSHSNFDLINTKVPYISEINYSFFKYIMDIIKYQNIVRDYKTKKKLYGILASLFDIFSLDDNIFLHEGSFESLKTLKKSRPDMFVPDDFGISEFDALIDSKKATMLSKNMDYGFACTCHKIQGTTIQFALIDHIDICNKVTQKEIFKDGKPFVTERNTLLYVALTRAKKLNFVLTE